MKQKIKFGNSIIEYQVVKSKRTKTSQITVDKENVIVRTPKTKSNSAIRQMIKDRKQWIFKKQLEFVNRERIKPSAKKLNTKIIAFSDGGKLEEYCKKYGIEYHRIPQFHSPRASLPAYIYTALNVLMPILPITKADVIESITKLEEMEKKISSYNLTRTNPSLDLAEWIKGIPLIYYPYGLQAAAIRFKNSLQENAKTHAMIEDVIETCHNGIVSWERPSNVQPVLIEGKDDYIKTKERWDLLKEYFEANQIDYREILSVEGNILSKLINLIYLLDYSTIFLAILNKIDPSPVNSIEFIKKKASID